MAAVQDQLSTAKELPAEVWLEVFEQVPNPCDLYNVSVTCRKFHELTTRAMHRDVIWTKARAIVQDLPAWRRHEGMEPFVRSLVLGVNRYVPGIMSRVVHPDGTVCEKPRGYRVRDEFTRRKRYVASKMDGADRFYASHALYEIIWQRVETFKNVTSLTLTNMLVYAPHFQLIHSLEHLRTLCLEWCYFQSGAAAGVNNRTLPITDLTMLNVRRGNSAADFGEWEDPNQPPALQFGAQHQFGGQIPFGGQNVNWHLPIPTDHVTLVLTLATAQNLRTLTVDSSADVFCRVFNHHDAANRQWMVPQTLEEIYVVRKRTCVGEEAKPSIFTGDATFPDTHLYAVCAQARGLKTVSTPLYVPSQMTIVPEMVPLGLERFSAPIESAVVIAAIRDVKALGLLKSGVCAREGIMALTNIAAMRPGLLMLSIECKGWDAEVVSAIAQQFKKLRRLKIAYDGPGPNEVRHTPNSPGRSMVLIHTCCS